MFQKILTTITLILYSSVNITAQNSQEWTTWWEKSNYLETPRYQETIEFSKKLAEASPLINYGTFGVSPQGRDLAYLVLDKDGLTNPVEIRNKNRVIVLVEAAIHPGESDGKDAMFVLFRDIAINKQYDEFLEDISIIFIPIFNVDGHERFSPYSRINQNGPKEGGWRVTAQNLDLNRDFVKADSPEMKAWLKFFDKWNPDFFIDCHTTDGSDHQYPLTYIVKSYYEESVVNWIDNQYVPEITKVMEEAGMPIFPYVAFKRWHDPRSGLRYELSSPTYANGYAAVRNRPGLLIETHMFKDYKTRVIATREMVYNTLIIIQSEKEELVRLIKSADEYTSSKEFREKPCVLKYSTSQTDSTMVKFRGIDYTVEKSDLTGGDWVRYNGKKHDFNLPFYNILYPSVQVELPEAYVIPAQWETIIERLNLHGIKYYELPDSSSIEYEYYKFSNVEWRKAPYEGRFRIQELNIESYDRRKLFEKGSVIIPMNQSKAYLIAFMLEPASEDSFLRWGFFNGIFEQKEYVETYVMEEMAREMIKDKPSLKDDFEKWKLENPEIQENSYAQLMWFYRKTPYFDSELNVYPVGRIHKRHQWDKLLKQISE